MFYQPKEYIEYICIFSNILSHRYYKLFAVALYVSTSTDCASLMSFCRKLKTFLFLYHFHDYIFLFSGPWGFYLGHFKNFLCMYFNVAAISS